MTMSTAGSFWEPRLPPGDDSSSDFPPIPEERIREWEGRNSLRLPASLAEALAVRNGGRVFGTEIWINPLDEFSLLSPTRDGTIILRPATRRHSRGWIAASLLVGEACGCGVVLDYGRGPEPDVLVMHHNYLGGELRDEGCGTFDEFIDHLRR